MVSLTKYWIEFEENENTSKYWLQRCYGVTAYTYLDALNILKEIVFKKVEFPLVKKYVENIDFSKLDQGHVIPNIAPTFYFRGIWFPLGYQMHQSSTGLRL